MSRSLTPLLFYPFEKESLSWPKSHHKVLFLYAEYDASVSQLAQVEFYHPFKSHADLWSAKGYKPATLSLQESKSVYDFVMCALPKQKEQAMFLIAQAMTLLLEGGLFIGVAANDAGGKKIEGWLQGLGVQTCALPKQKAKITWAKKQSYDKKTIQNYHEAGQAQIVTIEKETYLSQPGVFGWNKVDAGSRLLVDTIQESLKGIGADFGVGYGYIAKQVLKTHQSIEKLYAIEADRHALDCAKANLKEFTQVEYLWADIVGAQDLPDRLDFIVMNPPFHHDKQADIALGEDFIHKAALCLKKNGILYMVANRHLPYEKTMAHHFSKVEKMCEDKAFKIYKATK